MSAAQFMTGELIAFVTVMGIDADIVSLAAATPPNTIRVVTLEEALRFRITNSVPTPAPWELQPYRGGMVLATHGIENQTPYIANISCRANNTGSLSMKISFPYDINTSYVANPTNDLQKNYSGAAWMTEKNSIRVSMDTTVDRLIWSDGRLFTDIALLQNHIEALEKGDTLELSLNISFYFKTMPRLSFRVDQFVENRRLLLNNCPR